MIPYVNCMWSSFRGHTLDYSIPVEYAWLLESIDICRRVVGYRQRVDTYE